MFLGYQNGKIVMVAKTREELEQKPCVALEQIVQAEEDYALFEGTYLPVSLVRKKKALQEKNFLLKDWQKQLEQLDKKSIRALRALSAGQGNESDKNKLEELEAQAASIRARIQAQTQDTDNTL